MADSDPAVLSASTLRRYERFSLYNSPYVAHDRGCAIDLYPGSDGAPSPVTGTVREIRTVRAPPKPYAAERDHLILIDVKSRDRVARVLHVDPAVTVGDSVAVGDSLGATVRAGFFAPWVDDHVHLEFREEGTNLLRASGSLAVEVDVPVDALSWDGTGTVVETGDTYAVLDAPAHPAPGERFVAVASDGGAPLDGGLPHYEGGGVLVPTTGPMSLLGTRIGTAAGRDLAWDGVTVRANGDPITGLSLFAARDAGFGAKLVCPDREFAIGDAVTVTIRR